MLGRYKSEISNFHFRKNVCCTNLDSKYLDGTHLDSKILERKKLNREDLEFLNP